MICLLGEFLGSSDVMTDEDVVDYGGELASISGLIKSSLAEVNPKRGGDGTYVPPLKFF